MAERDFPNRLETTDRWRVEGRLVVAPPGVIVTGIFPAAGSVTKYAPVTFASSGAAYAIEHATGISEAGSKVWFIALNDAADGEDVYVASQGRFTVPIVDNNSATSITRASTVVIASGGFAPYGSTPGIFAGQSMEARGSLPSPTWNLEIYFSSTRYSAGGTGGG